MDKQFIRAKYLIETRHPLEAAAGMMAGEQSCGTFVRVPGETDELRARFSARVDSITERETVDKPALSGAKGPKSKDAPIRRAIVDLSWPFENVGANLPNLMATVAGNLYELNPFSGLKLLDLEIPEAFGQKYPGPQFGIRGTRELTGVSDRPIIGTIIKPSVGLTPEATAEQTKTLIEAGLDFLKDDELMGNPPHSPFEKRVEMVMNVINAEAEKTGRKAMFAFNISGDVDEMLYMHDIVLARGGTCVMVSINHVGLSGIAKLRTHSQLPIHGHRNFWGAVSRSEVLGIDFQAYQKIWRLAGIDHLHTNGIRNKFCESDESVIRSIKACLTPMLGGYEIMPVISSGQWAGQAVDTFQAIRTTDVMYVCGGGIVAHPGGIAAGVRSVQQGWEAAMSGESLTSYAERHIELKQAIEAYG
ncbi:ribulose-bisphosphate carboxylase large subunit family protein [Dyadobacter bucti]|uniref:ribulose-bisphosphate carboxylase large subunit family protein n=1 Tax=Dyadobacter bucti TaxID=2572203 RepID=UPI00110865B1|nr:ribulose-bisphosphate carboxylase large subunit family protein [Dyadobacter bucti]